MEKNTCATIYTEYTVELDVVTKILYHNIFRNYDGFTVFKYVASTTCKATKISASF